MLLSSLTVPLSMVGKAKKWWCIFALESYYNQLSIMYVMNLFLVHVRLRTDVPRTLSSSRLGFEHDLQIMTVNFMSLRCLLEPLDHQSLKRLR